jgi:hypothetical protein
MAMGRIEHTLLDEGRASSPSDLRPSPATPPYHTKVTDVPIYDKRTGIPIKIPAWLVPRSGRDGGGKSQPDDGLSNLTSWALGVVNIRCGVFKARFDTDRFVL